jgi:large subunit ribosomal protein L21
MYAVIETGGKQYRVQTGDIVQIEKLEAEMGKPVKFDHVLMLGKPSEENSQIWLGKPYVNGAHVEGEVVGEGRGEKVLIVKMKKRKQYRRTQGHRQFHTQVLVTGLSNGAGETLTLSADDRKKLMASFQTHLTPKGPAHSKPVLGSRKRAMAAHKAPGTHTEAKSTSAATPTTEKKTAAAPKAKKTVKKS